MLSLSRDAIEKLIVIPDDEETIAGHSNMLDENNGKSYFIESGYLLHLILVETENEILDVEGSQLSGTEGIWNVSKLFLLYLNCHDVYFDTHLFRRNWDVSKLFLSYLNIFYYIIYYYIILYYNVF